MTSAEFQPSFREDVFVRRPGPPITQVNRLYCATDQCASDLSLILADLKPNTVTLPPFGPTFYGDVDFVPWFAFPDGSLANAGLLASYWTHGWTPEIAERNCRRDVQSLMEYNALGK